MVMEGSGHNKSGCENLVMKSWSQMDVVAKKLVVKLLVMNTMVNIPDENYWRTLGYMKWMEQIYSQENSLKLW